MCVYIYIYIYQYLCNYSSYKSAQSPYIVGKSKVCMTVRNEKTKF